MQVLLASSVRMLARGRRRQPRRFNVLAQLNVGLLLAQLAFLAAPWKHLAARRPSGKVAPPPPVRRIPAPELLAKCRAALSDAGLEEGACGPVAASIVAAQRDGKTAHGLGRLNAMVAHRSRTRTRARTRTRTRTLSLTLARSITVAPARTRSRRWRRERSSVKRSLRSRCARPPWCAEGVDS